MPRLYDRKPRATDDHNPLKNLLKYEDTDAYIRDDGESIYNNTLVDPAQSIAGLLQQTVLIGDILEALSGVEDGNVNDLGTAWNNVVGDIRATIDNIVTGLFGWIGTGWSQEDSEQAIADQAATTAALSAAVQALQNNYNNASVGGLSALVDFSLRADATSLGGDFTQTYTGSGTGLWGVEGGKADWLSVNDNDRHCTALYNAVGSATDYQMVGAAFASAPLWFNSSNMAHNFLYARMDAAATTGVYVAFQKYGVELGCLVGGVRTVFATKTSGFSFKANSMYWLRCGTIGGLRVFQVLDNTTPIITHTEVGTTSQLGASYRYTGMGVSAAASGLGTSPPGRVLAFAFADNQPPTLVGSYGEMQRTNVGNVTMNSGVHELPNSFFDTPGPTTADVTADFVNGSFTVSKEGQYRCGVRAAVGIAFVNQFTWVLYVNGLPVKHVGSSHIRGVNALGGNETPEGCSGEIVIPLQANDEVSWGYSSSGSAIGVLTGEVTGSETYCSISLENRSLA